MTKVEVSPSQRAELERMVRAAPIPLARRARVILEHAGGIPLNVIALHAGLHRDSCRRWLLRYRAGGVAGLQHGNAGKPKNVVFDAATRDEICRRAGMDPAALGEPWAEWSLYKLRDHLIHRRLVRTISVERLRQLLRDRAVDRRYWREAARRIGTLTPEVRRQLLQLAHHPQADRALRARVMLAVAAGTSIANIARTFHVGKNNIRRWIGHFRLAGVAGLTLGVPTLRKAIVRLTRVPPRALGASGDEWSLSELRAVLRREGVAPVVRVDELRRVAEAAGIALAEHDAPRRAADVTHGLTNSHGIGSGQPVRR